MRGWLAPLCAVLAIVSATAAGAQDAAYESSGMPAYTGSPFVRVVGDRFYANGSPFRFVGANVAVMHGEAHRAAALATLGAAAGDGLRVVRLWALGEREQGAPEWARSYAFRFGPEGWIEESFVHLDRVLAEAGRLGLRVIVVLANRWADYGGLPQYLRWSGDPFDADVPDGIARAQLGTFFASASAQSSYLAHVDRVTQRVNTITGIAYRDDPTILAWELVNEISAERRDAPALGAFVAAAARHIHALDPNHLVSAGHIGYSTASERRTWREIASLPEVDFADAHAYPTEHDRVRTLAELDAFVDDHAMLAHGQLHKPLVLGELGFVAGRRALHRSRAQLFDHFLEHADLAGVDGMLAWIYAPSSDHAGRHGILADHPNADSRRVRAVLREHARAIAASIATPEWPPTDAPLWDPSRTIAGTRRIARPAARTGVVSIAPEDFTEACFESVGRYDGAGIAQLYGAGHGWVTYRFRAPASLGTRVRVALRASSELPGRGVGATADDGSQLWVQIDGQPVGTLAVPPDDAIGRLLSLEAPIDEALATAMAASRVHTIRFEVHDDDDAHGLCLYGAATGLEELDPAVAAELPGRVEIAFLP